MRVKQLQKCWAKDTSAPDREVVAEAILLGEALPHELQPVLQREPLHEPPHEPRRELQQVLQRVLRHEPQQEVAHEVAVLGRQLQMEEIMDEEV